MRVLFVFLALISAATAAEITLHPAFPFSTSAHPQPCTVSERQEFHSQPVPLIGGDDIAGWRVEFPKASGLFITRGKTPLFFSAQNTVFLKLTPSARARLLSFYDLPLTPKSLVLRVNAQDLAVIHLDQQLRALVTADGSPLGDELFLGVDPKINLFELLGTVRFDPGMAFATIHAASAIHTTP